MDKGCVFYMLDTTRVNAQTIYCLVMGIEPRLSNSFEFCMRLVRALIIPHIENRPLIGLHNSVLRKMTMTLGKEVKPHVPAVPNEMENYPSHGNRRRCKMCEIELAGKNRRER